MPSYTVVSGDTLSEIGARHGVDWRDIWNHPKNAAVRDKNGSPDRIYPGDVFWIPGDDEVTIEPVFIPGPAFDDDERIAPLHAGSPYVEEYKVKSGDTIQSIAEAIGMTWEELAIFNWGTDDPNEINWYLENYFVCTKKSGANYVFTDQDEPGILYLPRGVEPDGKRMRRGAFAVSRWRPED